MAVRESTGDFVAVWTSFEETGSDERGLGVYAQRFHADGTPVDASFLVNTNQLDGDQFAPSVAIDAAGNFAIAWQGYDSDGWGIYLHRYMADGTPIGATTQVNQNSDDDQEAPSVAMDNAGNLIVAWQSIGQDGDEYGVYARRYDATGAATSGGEFLVNSVVVGNQRAPTVAVARDNGNFVVAWEGDVAGEHDSVEIFAQLYDSTGDTISAEFQVNADAAREQVLPNVAMDADGDFIVTWITEGIPGSGSDVFARQFDAIADPAGNEFRVNNTLLQGQTNPVVAMNADGDYFVTWQSSHQDGFSWGIFGRAYDSFGNELTPELQVNTYAEQPQTLPALGSNSEGNLVAAWLGLDEDHAAAVHAQRFQLPTSESGFTPVGTEVVLANYLDLEDASAAAATNANGDYFVVWQSYGEDGSGLNIQGRRLDSAGAPAGETFLVNTTTNGNQSNPAVAMDNTGNAVVVWEALDAADGSRGIFAQRFEPTGVAVGAEFLVNTGSYNQQTNPAVTMNPATGDFVVAWQSDDESGQGIYAQRFASTGGKMGDQFQVNSEIDLDQVSPAIAMNEAGQFAVTWVSDHRALIDPENDSEKSIFVQWYDASGNSFGPEQLAHTIVKDFEAQEYPDIAIDAAGNMIVVWQSITQDGSAWGVYGRQLLADKSPVQPAEFQINQKADENQRHATVVCSPDGAFTVSWQSDLQDQSATAIVSRQYNADGTPETDEMLVNTWEMGPQILPVMAMTPNGDFGIFWSGQGNSRTEGIHGRIFVEGYRPPLPHITVVPHEEQLLVSKAAAPEVSPPGVAVVSGTGNFVATWTSFEQEDNDESGFGVYAQTFLADGTPSSEAFLVNTAQQLDDQSQPAVAVDAAGRFIVVWQSLYADGDGLGIYGQRYAADGTPIGPAFAINDFAAGDQSHPAVAMDDAGNFLVTWQSDGQDGDGLGIYARRYGDDGVAIDAAEFLVNTVTAGNQAAPTVALAGNTAQFVIGWQSEVLGTEGEVDVQVLANLYGVAGLPTPREFTVNSTSEHDQVEPSVSMAPSGDFVFAWTVEGQQGSGADVYAQRFDDAGDPQGNEFKVNTTTQRGQEHSSVGMDEAGNFIVSWQSSHQDGFSWGVYSRAFDNTGAPLTEEMQVNQNVQGPQTSPTLGINADGDAVVVWLGLDATHHPAIHARQYELPGLNGEFAVGPQGELVLNNYMALEEARAAAGVDGDGNYVVAWQSYAQDGSGLGVYGRRFNAAGEARNRPIPGCEYDNRQPKRTRCSRGCER